MKKNLYKEYLKKQKIKSKSNEEVVIKEQGKILKTLNFLVYLISKILYFIFYLAIIIFCSIGATYVFNKFILGGQR